MSFFNGGLSSPWVVSALSLFAVSFFQLWIVLIPVVSLSRSAILMFLSLIISILLPILFMKNRTTILHQFKEMIPEKLKMVLSVIVISFFLIVQPFALLYFGEKIIGQFLGSSYHFMLVFLISVAGLSALIGGKKVVMYANAMFGIIFIVSMLMVMYVGASWSAPLMFLQLLFSEGTQFFQNHNVFESNWLLGFFGFSVITWWMWWIDNGAFHVQGKQSEQRSSNASLFASFPLIVIALVVLPGQGNSEPAMLNVSPATTGFAISELQVFFFALGFISLMVSVFSHSFHTVATIVATQFFRDRGIHDDEEKHILVGRIMIVLSAFLAIVYIQFAQFFGAVTLLLYVQYIVCVAASIAGAFTVFFFRKKYYQVGIATGIIGGIGAGIVVVVMTYSETKYLMPFLMTPYGTATGIFLFSMLCSFGGSVLVERKAARNTVTV